ncbi:Acetyl-CoA acetyltransferase [Solimonas aquatica]|uniref:Acetyl-CoA acetyltransferase n=1 Tax=Solimonas aquatica TaxID=489703 RepID=A0A1H9FJC3_9GAMM|nr:thiolase family protein [Solimonas aquatica]SEQ38019.1 Acetyl-CoA acetyltransferase [Solimonas aquatica]
MQARMLQQHAYIAGVGMTAFARHAGRGLKSLGAEALRLALADAGLEPQSVQAAYLANAAAPLVTGQSAVGGQVLLRELGIGGIAVVNVENADAGGATAFHQACAMVSAGYYDVVLACAYEKLHQADAARADAALGNALDVERADELQQLLRQKLRDAGLPSSGSCRLDLLGVWAWRHMHAHGTTREQLAQVVVKNAQHAMANPYAALRERVHADALLAAPLLTGPLGAGMCAPLVDGAAAAVVVSPRKLRELGLRRAVRVRASVLASGWETQDEDDIHAAEQVAQRAYTKAEIGPQDLHCIELHDPSAACEILYYEHLGLCAPGEGGELLDSGATRLGGRLPVNPSGGLLRRGHAGAASGMAQIAELVWQLRGEAGARQVQKARLALAHSGGGVVGREVAAIVINILESA